MRQEVRVRVTLTYDADATLDERALHDAIHDDLLKLRDDSEPPRRVELQRSHITSITEEAVIYGLGD